MPKIIKTKRVKEFAKEVGLHLGSATPPALNELVEKILKKAADRCVKNGRRTIIPGDL